MIAAVMGLCAFGLGTAVGRIGKQSMQNMWSRMCDAVSADLIWRYRVAFHADYDQNFDHELRKFDKDLADEVKDAFRLNTISYVINHYTAVNRYIHLACYIRIFKLTNSTETVRILYIVIIYKILCLKLK